MKIRSVNYTNSANSNATEHNNRTGKRNPAFGNALVGLASFIENNGFMGEFLTIDTCGMGAPRAIQGYMRNSKELGHLNYKAGHEEVTRELLSGPAFFFVPLIVTSIFGLAKGKSALVQKKTMLNLQNLLKKSEVNLADAAATKKNFVKTVIKDAFGENPKEKELVENLSNLLEQNLNGKFSMLDSITNLFKKDGEKVMTQGRLKKEAEKVLTKLNKANEQFLDSADSLKIETVAQDGTKSWGSVKVKSFMDDARDYLADFTQKAAKTTKDKEAFIDEFQNNASKVRTAAEVSSIAALSAFIAYIPKLYQTGKFFPGKDGLVANPEQTNNNPANTKEVV